VAELNVKPLTAVMLKGLLAPQLDSVNMVNAPLLCRERDIRVSETRMTAEGDFHTLMRVTLTTERRTRSVAGTLFRGRQPRLVMIEDVPMEAELGANMLFVRNKVRPASTSRPSIWAAPRPARTPSASSKWINP
jgi:D-3-phosphoglycerate dehydrogenase